jgi:Actin-like ATPase involved in cell morphogenesis
MFSFLGKKEEVEEEKKQALSNTLGIDLGTLNTVVARPSGDKFDLFKIPSVVAVKKEDPGYVLAVGEEAKAMLGRTPEDIIAVRPLRQGVIESIAQAESLLLYSMDLGSGEDTASIDRIVVGIPGDASEVEKKPWKILERKPELITSW